MPCKSFPRSKIIAENLVYLNFLYASLKTDFIKKSKNIVEVADNLTLFRIKDLIKMADFNENDCHESLIFLNLSVLKFDFLIDKGR